ncbi:phage minor head protein [Caproicibacter fermentans]|uniref:phage minor head protein n=1 Tax=Caproicibacter fermentans TaxID=2576756 RepID=UPI0014129198
MKKNVYTFQPPTIQSTRWKHWVAQLDFKTCFTCRNHHGKIYSVNEIPDIEPPVHPNCRCEVQNMEAVFAGEATKDSENGADWWIKEPLNKWRRKRNSEKRDSRGVPN